MRHLLIIAGTILILFAFILLQAAQAQETTPRAGMAVQIADAEKTDNALNRLLATIPPDWLAASEDTARYLLVLTPLFVEVERCDYIPQGALTRIQINLEARVTDLETGETIGRQSFEGLSPPGCPAILNSGDPREYYGVPDVVQFGRWVYDTMTAADDGLPSVNVRIPLPLWTGFVTTFSANFSPDGQHLVTVSTRVVSATAGDTVQVWNVATGEELLRLVSPPEGPGYTDASYSPDGRRIVVGSREEVATAYIFDAETGEPVLQLQGGHICGGTCGVEEVSYSPDGSAILTAGGDDTARVWDAETGEELFQLDHTSPVSGIVDHARYSPDGHTILTARYDRNFVGTVRVWGADSGAEILQLPSVRNWPIYFARYSPDGRTFVTDGPGAGVYVWDAATGEELNHFGDNQFWAAAYHPDGRLIATGDRGGTVLIWDAAAGRVLEQLSWHNGRVGTLDYSSDGRYLASAGDDDVVLIWDMSDLPEASSN